MLFSNEIQIYQTIHLLINQLTSMKNQLNWNYLIYNINDNFMIFKACCLLT